MSDSSEISQRKQIFSQNFCKDAFSISFPENKATDLQYPHPVR